LFLQLFVQDVLMDYNFEIILYVIVLHDMNYEL